MSTYRTLFAPGQFVPFTSSILFANAACKKPYFPLKEDHNRPAASLSLYNHTQSNVVITLEPGIPTYLPNLFLQDRYNDAICYIDSPDGEVPYSAILSGEHTVDELTMFTIAQPLNCTKPVLRSAKSKS